MSPKAGAPAEAADLVDVDALLRAYHERVPDVSNPAQRVAFGTSGHRGSSLSSSFNEPHIAAITQAIVEYRAAQRITGPLFLGADTHALSAPALETALEVLAGNGVRVLVDAHGGWVPTPALSLAILAHNRGQLEGIAWTGGHDVADGIAVTPSHNPPADGGFKYNPPHGGPADSNATSWIAERANELIAAGTHGVRRARPAGEPYDFRARYVEQIGNVVDIDAIRRGRVRLGVDPLGGASVSYWDAIRDHYGLDLTVVNPAVDPTWRFMTLDWDGKIRMDPSSRFAMAGVLAHRHEFDVLVANDTDADRHGVVTADAGLMNPNAYLAAAIQYLFTHRPHWPAKAAVGKTLVSSSMIDRVAAALARRLWEVPVGFKWFVPGLIDGEIAFGGEESAGASLLRMDGTVWTTDKDGIVLGLLAAEMRAVTGKTPSELYAALTAVHGDPAYERIDAPATAAQKAALAKLDAAAVTATQLAGEPITLKLSRALGNGAPIGGVKIGSASAWFAARPSGTEDVYKIYAESFRGAQHLRDVQRDARQIVAAALGG
jgi:phosphoglucomutase